MLKRFILPTFAKNVLSMKNQSKKRIVSVFRVVAIAAVIGITLTACGKPTEKEKKLSGTVTANTDGVVKFMYSRLKSSCPAACAFTTDLPAPDNQFVLTIASGESTVEKLIEGLSAGQKLSWTATVEGKPLNHGSGYFVHIINDD
jgi:hypothetical protein